MDDISKKIDTIIKHEKTKKCPIITEEEYLQIKQSEKFNELIEILNKYQDNPILCVKKNGEVNFAHLTYKEHEESILKYGLLIDECKKNLTYQTWPYKAIYCVRNDEKVVERLKEVADYKVPPFVVAFGTYKGLYYEAVCNKSMIIIEHDVRITKIIDYGLFQP